MPTRMENIPWFGNQSRRKLEEEIRKCERQIELINNSLLPFPEPKKTKKMVSHEEHFERGFFSI
jgi:hypothetical protein